MFDKMEYTRQKAFNEVLSIMNTLHNPDQLLREKNASINIYDSLAYDGHVDSCLDSRAAGLFSNEWGLRVRGDADANEKKALEMIKENLAELDVESILEYLQYSVYYGYGVQEFTRVRDGRRILIDSINGLPREWFTFDIENRMRFLSSSDSLDGESVDESRLLLSQYRATYQNPFGKGKYSSIYFPVGVKRALFKYGAKFAEKLGGAILLAYTDDDNRKTELLQMLHMMINSSAGVVTNGEKIEQLKVDRNGSGQIFLNFINLCDKEISKCILGQTLTTEQGSSGSYSLGKVHFQVRKEVVERDKKYVTKYINQLIKRIVDENFDNIKHYPELHFFEEENIQKERAERDLILTQQGVRFEEEYYRDNYRLNEDHFKIMDVSGNPEGATDEGGPKPAGKPKKFSEVDELSFFSEQTAKLAEREDEQIEQLTEKTTGNFNLAFSFLFKRLEKALQESSNYNEAIRNIAASVPGLPGDLVGKVGKGFLTADIIGRGYAVALRDEVAQFAEDDLSKLGDLVFDYTDIDFLKMKIPMTTDEFRKLDSRYRNYAFTVTEYEKQNQVEAVFNSLIEAKEQNRSFKEWKSALLEKGFSVSDLTYWQNMRAAQGAGRYAQMMEDVDIAPYWQLICVKDVKTRQEHLAMNGLIRRYDDPIWDTWYPPNGYRCRCTVRSLSREYLLSKGISPESLPKGLPKLDEVINNNKKNKASGDWYDQEVFPKNIQRLLKSDGQLKLKADPGFEVNAGRDLWSWKKALAGKSKKDGRSLVKERMNLSKELKGRQGYSYQPEVGLGADYLHKNLSLDYFRQAEQIMKAVKDTRDIPAITEALNQPDLVLNDIIVKDGKTNLLTKYVKKVRANNKDIYYTIWENPSGWQVAKTGRIRGVKRAD